MRTVILGDPPKEIEDLINSRRSTGADRRDEVWEGDYHMNPAPRTGHAMLVIRMAALIDDLLEDAGLTAVADFNIGVPDNYRIPDAGVLPADVDQVYVDTAPLVIEVVSPGDESWEKLPFYASHGISEAVIVEPDDRRVSWFVLSGDTYEKTEISPLLSVPVDDIVARIDWPGA